MSSLNGHRSFQWSSPATITYFTLFLFHYPRPIIYLVREYLLLHQRTMVLETITLNASQWSPGSSPATISSQLTPASLETQARAARIKPAPSKPLGQREYERDRLVRKCMSRQVHVVNLMSLMPAWPKDIHSQEILDEVNVEIDEWLKK